jgi:hypothetical protein
LVDVLRFDEPLAVDRIPDFVAEFAVFGTVGAAVIIEADMKAGEIPFMFGLNFGYQAFFAAAFFPGANRNGRAVRIVGTNVNTAMTAKSLKANPNIGLDVLDQVADVDRPVGIRQCGGDENLAACHNRFAGEIWPFSGYSKL